MSFTRIEKMSQNNRKSVLPDISSLLNPFYLQRFPWKQFSRENFEYRMKKLKFWTLKNWRFLGENQMFHSQKPSPRVLWCKTSAEMSLHSQKSVIINPTLPMNLSLRTSTKYRWHKFRFPNSFKVHVNCESSNGRQSHEPSCIDPKQGQAYFCANITTWQCNAHA